jgi:hypothetical protein
MSAALTSSDVTFDQVAHEYFLPDGQRVPSVTEVLSAVGISTDFEGLSSRSSRIGEAIALKRDIGQALHADAHAFDDDDLDWTTVDPRVEPYLTAYVTFRANSGVRPTTRERRVFHPQFRYAGTLDGIFQLADGRRVLIDLKTGDPDDSACAWQTAAYEAAHLVEHPGHVIHERWGVQLVPGAQVPYRIHRYTDWRDFAAFQAFLTTYHHQAARRVRRRS